VPPALRPDSWSSRSSLLLSCNGMLPRSLNFLLPLCGCPARNQSVPDLPTLLRADRLRNPLFTGPLLVHVGGIAAAALNKSRSSMEVCRIALKAMGLREPRRSPRCTKVREGKNERKTREARHPDEDVESGEGNVENEKGGYAGTIRRQHRYGERASHG
jgi:hypothetical protein